MILVIARRMQQGGYLDEHIASVKWRDTSTGKEGTSEVWQMVEFLDKGNKAYTGDPLVEVIPVHRNGRSWITTSPDATTRNNLLSLPLY